MRTNISSFPKENIYLQGRILTVTPTRYASSLTSPSLWILCCTAPCAGTVIAGQAWRLNQCSHRAIVRAGFCCVFLKLKLVSISGSLGSPGNCWATQWLQEQRNWEGAAVTALSSKKPSSEEMGGALMLSKWRLESPALKEQTQFWWARYYHIGLSQRLAKGTMTYGNSCSFGDAGCGFTVD